MKNLGKPGYSHCNGDKANLDSLKAQEATRLSIARDVAIQSNIETEKLRNERQDKLKADSYNPVIVSISKFLAWIASGNYTDYIKMATVLITLIVAIAFEILHHFLSHAKERAQNAVYGLELELAKFEGSALPDKPESVIPRNDGGFKKSGIGFTAPIGNTAKYGDSGSHSAPIGKAGIDTTAPLFKYQQEPQEKHEPVKKVSFGFVPSRPANTAKLDSTVSSQPVPDSGTTYRQALRAGSNEYRNTPLDAPIQQPEKPRVEPRARGLLEPDENHVHAVSDEPANAPAAEGREGADSLYPQWVAAVRAKECRPTVNHSRLWIQRRIAPTMTGSKTNDLKRIDAMRKGFFARAIREGLMQLNSNYTNGGKKYIWIG